jgi:hypothetical protein
VLLLRKKKKNTEDIIKKKFHGIHGTLSFIIQVYLKNNSHVLTRGKQAEADLLHLQGEKKVWPWRQRWELCAYNSRNAESAQL